MMPSSTPLLHAWDSRGRPPVNMSTTTLERTVNSSTSMATILPPLDYLELASVFFLHNDATHLTRSIMREAGLVSNSEAWNMFHGKVPSPYIDQHSTAINRERGDKRSGSDRRQCMVPDIITSSSTTTQALIVLDELAETVVMPLPCSR